MARTSKNGSPARSGKAKPAKAQPKKKTGAPRKAAGKTAVKVPVKGPAKTAAKGAAKGAKGKVKSTASKGASKASPLSKPAKHDPGHARHMEEVRRQVARRRPGAAPDDVLHAQKDPSIVTPPGPPTAPVDQLHQNWGEVKQKTVTRLDKPTNWFRQAPKKPEK